MPVVHVHMWSGRTITQKRLLARAITEAMVEHASAKPDHLHVTISEYEPENWARSGVLAADVAESAGDDAAVASTPSTSRGATSVAGTGWLHHALIECADLAASESFYVSVVGLCVRARSQHRDGRPLILTHNGIGLTERLDSAGGGNLDHFALPVSSVADVHTRAREAGAPVARGPLDGPYGYSIYLIDPNGIEVELFEPITST